ncbi:hypothetical protein [Thermobrachium celere]|uniref:Uncharacterized protein n=1 Tax=Thermobrachium celere DSM 8682 TaxID=941824 RepID=R7RQ62_9CLOT|nr:hypothetical protein [Thermobrachium celere]CDF58352.1 hypothetical protein TCEL_00398 [Thermobrachium celere DSM 8682]
MLICPVCNGIVEYTAICPICKNSMKVLDRVEYYYDEYSLNQEQDLNDISKDMYCSHYCYCEMCNKTIITKVDKVKE